MSVLLGLNCMVIANASTVWLDAKYVIFNKNVILYFILSF